MTCELFLIDGIGPFFEPNDCRRRNWSKIPFAELETQGQLDVQKTDRIRRDFRCFIERAAAEGFNAISLDDVMHLVDLPNYPQTLVEKIQGYRELYAELASFCDDLGMQVYITGDVLSVMSGDNRSDRLLRHVAPYFYEAALQNLTALLPNLGGIILRIGECDGKDVGGDFHSRLIIKKASHAKAFLQNLLPAFEHFGKRLIFRTWTVGAYPIGDLIWNKRTYDRVFNDIQSDALVISMKYGESDFFRYLPFNKLLYRGPHTKLLELQSRREYEGAGRFPSFIGWDYEKYAKKAETAHLAGISVWAQTGGWTKFGRRTFIDRDALWNDLNTSVTIQLFKDRVKPHKAVRRFAAKYLPEVNCDYLLALLRLSDQAVKKMIYIETIAQQRFFFRRVRIPPLLHVYWDNIMITHSLRKLLRGLVEHPEELLRADQQCMKQLRMMPKLAELAKIPTDDILFLIDTLEILAAARCYFFGTYHADMQNELELLRNAYGQKYAIGYDVLLDFKPFKPSSKNIHRMWRFFIRPRKKYRRLDRLVLIHILALAAPLLRMRRNKALPEFAEKQAMGIDTLLR